MTHQEEELTTDEEIKKSYWWVTHIIQIKKRIMGVIIGIIAIWLLIILFVAIFLFIVQRDQDASMRTALQDQTSAFSIANSLEGITVSDVGILIGSGQSFDLYALVKNPNQEWWLNYTYQFYADGKPLKERSSFLFPGEQNYVLLLAQNISGSAKIDVKITSQKWHHITKRERQTLAERHRFSVAAIQYTPPEQTGTGFAVPISSVSFTVKNNSPFSFSEIMVPIIAKQNDAIVAVAQIPLYNIRPEEQRTRAVQWFHSFAQPTSFDIRPTVNVLSGAAPSGSGL